MNKIQRLRALTGLSQAQFATLIGVPKTTLMGWEQDRRNPAKYSIQWLEAFLKEKGYSL